MRKGAILFIVIGLFILGISTQARSEDVFWTGSLFNETLGGMVGNISVLDWSSSGSGVATGLGPFGTIFSPGTPFTLNYQSFLAGVMSPDGNNVPFAGLNKDFEYTMVAQINEEVISTSKFGSFTTEIFKTTGGSFKIYYDGTPNSKVSSGFGFDDGTMVASGIIPAEQLSIFTTIPHPKTGIGSTIVGGTVDYINPSYIEETSGLDFSGFRFEATINYPPHGSRTSAFFNGRTGEGNYPTYTVDKNDLLVKMDGSGRFTVAPEPVSVLLFVIGGMVFASVYMWKNKKKTY